MADCASLLALAAEAAGAKALTFRGHTVDPFVAPQRVTLAEAFDRFARIDLLASVGADGATDREALAAARWDRGSALPPTTPGPMCSAGCWSRR
jgi:lysyl-tRNA synthetase class 2